jgi:16S rRNA (guanine(527)-N(7))-methyltransferase RsmG
MAESANELKQLLLESGINLESRIAHQLLTFLVLLIKWNSTANLTSTTEWIGIGPLFREAIWASRLYPDKAVSHLDIGSGGGFPAIPIRIINPHIQLEMVESQAKRCIFLEMLADALEAGNVRVHNMRLKSFLQCSMRDKAWDCISWKAVKLKPVDLRNLRDHAHAETQFWMFHGKELAVEKPEEFLQKYRLMRREKFGEKRFCFLSIYRLR